MSGADLPWWATPPPDEAADAEDPVEAFRRARAAGSPDDEHREGVAGDPAAHGWAAGHEPGVCGVCPICTLGRTLERVRPEVAEHLTRALSELQLAFRAAVDGDSSSRPPSTPDGDQG